MNQHVVRLRTAIRQSPERSIILRQYRKRGTGSTWSHNRRSTRQHLAQGTCGGGTNHHQNKHSLEHKKSGRRRFHGLHPGGQCLMKTN